MKNPSTSASSHKAGAPSVNLVGSRIVYLTLFNALLYWPWRWLRSAYDGGIHHPNLVLLLMAATLWGWWQLLTAITRRIKGKCTK